MEEDKEAVTRHYGGQRMTNIPLTELMQATHPGYSAYCQGKNMKEVQHPMFFDYCLKVCDTFHHYAAKHSTKRPYLYAEYSNTLHQILDYVNDLNETDEPAEVFDIRNKLEGACYAFEKQCSDMGKCFKSPENMAEYYDSLGKLLTHTIHEYAGII